MADRFVPTEVVEVHAWGHLVGAVAPSPAGRHHVFEYAPEWQRLGIELSPLHLPTSQRFHEFPSLPQETFGGLPALIADSLPDNYGRSLVDAHLARRGVTPGQVTALDRLAYLADRGMGALEYRPPLDTGAAPPSAVDVAEVVAVARAAVTGTLDSDEATSAALAQLLAVGTSAGGARAKAVVAYNPQTEELRSGQVPADAGFEHWLLKLDGVTNDQLGDPQQYGRIEYAYSLMARAAGIAMAPCRLLEEHGRAHFMTRRFDRPDAASKVHQQTLCAMDHLDYTFIGVHAYEQLFAVVDRLGLGFEARQEAFRRMVFNVAGANCDDHTKNVSFVLPDGGDWELSPAYDLTHAHDPGNKWLQRHLMSVNGRFADIRLEDLLQVADRFEVPGHRQVLDEVHDAVDAWPDFAVEAGLAADRIEKIRADLQAHRPR